jgi:hypothetical protein
MPVERRGQVTDVGVSQLATGGASILDGRRRSSIGGTSRMMREYHVRICERLGVKLPGPTRQRCGKGGWVIPSGMAQRASPRYHAIDPPAQGGCGHRRD